MSRRPGAERAGGILRPGSLSEVWSAGVIDSQGSEEGTTGPREEEQGLGGKLESCVPEHMDRLLQVPLLLPSGKWTESPPPNARSRGSDHRI